MSFAYIITDDAAQHAEFVAEFKKQIQPASDIVYVDDIPDAYPLSNTYGKSLEEVERMTREYKAMCRPFRGKKAAGKTFLVTKFPFDYDDDGNKCVELGIDGCVVLVYVLDPDADVSYFNATATRRCVMQRRKGESIADYVSNLR